MRALCESDSSRWEAELIRWEESGSNIDLLPELIWRSGMSDAAAAMLVSLLERGVVSAEAIGIFRLGRATVGLSEPAFQALIEQLLADSSGTAAAIAVELMHGYYDRGHKDRPLPAELAERVLLNDELFQHSASLDQSITGYLWGELANRAEAWKAAEDEPRIKDWLDWLKQVLAEDIESSKIREERDPF